MKLTPDRFWMGTHSYTLTSHKFPWTHQDSLTGATLRIAVDTTATNPPEFWGRVDIVDIVDIRVDM